MPKPLSISLTVIGAVLLVLAFFAGDSVSSGFSKVFQGTPDVRTIVLLILGLLFLVVGLTSTMRSRSS